MSASAAAPSRVDRGLPGIAAALALAPLLWCWSDFAALFYVGDEWDQLDQIARSGFWPWVIGFFGENFAPLFKLAWGTTVLAGGGGYFSLVALVWVAHALGVFLLARSMQCAGFSRAAIALAAVGFGLAAINSETLGWTVQLITVQGMVFFLAAAGWQTARENDGAWNRRTLAVLGTLVALSTFSFVRGPLTGCALAVAAIGSPWLGGASQSTWRTRAQVVAVCLVPGIVAVALMAKFAPGHPPHFGGPEIAAASRFSATYFLLSPFYRLFDVGTSGARTTIVLGLFKVVLLACGWKLARPGERRLLLTLLAFDLGNALLLGIGRFHTGLGAALSSRYQYISLLCTLPYAGPCLDALLRKFGRTSAIRGVAAAIVLIGFAVAVSYRWPREIGPWAGQSRTTRDRLSRLPPATLATDTTVTGLEWIPDARARELVARYHLH